MRTIIFGDVHGCNEALCNLIDKVKPIIGEDKLVFLGDLFDRGPDSYGVFQTIRNIQEQFGDDFILLRGNHEDYLLQPQLTRWQRMIWEHVGRQATVRSFLQVGENMEDTIPWLSEHVQLFWRTEDVQCVHAGIKIDPLEVNDLQTLIHDHDIVLQNHYTGRLTVTGHIALEKAMWFAGDGETTKTIDENKPQDLPETGILCIDTGCGKGGRLTAMIIEDKEYCLFSEAER